MKYLIYVAYVLVLVFQQYLLNETFRLNEGLQDVVMANLNLIDVACPKRAIPNK
jgi:hypothetical protein